MMRFRGTEDELLNLYAIQLTLSGNRNIQIVREIVCFKSSHFAYVICHCKSAVVRRFTVGYRKAQFRYRNCSKTGNSYSVI
jgi:hypothetical protein